MRSRFDESSEAGYAYYGGMLNAGYITGFVRRVEGKQFVVQQTNDPKLALPVVVEERNIPIPQDTMPVKVVGRFVGKRLENGERVLSFRAITLDRPSIREMPNRLAWEKPLLNGESQDGFKPFFDPMDNEDVSSPFYRGEKRNGRPCLNVARVAGFVESFAYKPSGPNDKNDCLYIALRQTENPDEALPIRVYGRFTEAFKQKIQVALPIFIEGFYRVKKENKGTAEAPVWESIPYIHCSNIKVATPADIKVRPAWWSDMKERLIRASKERIAQANASNGQKKDNGTKQVTKSKKPDVLPMEKKDIPKPPAEIVVDADL